MGSIFSDEKMKQIEEDQEMKKTLKRPDLQIDIELENTGLFQSCTKSSSELCKNSE